MRKIKFRAWDGHQKKMAHVVNVHTESDGSTFWSADHVNPETCDAISSFSDTKGNFTHLMQYTGLKDDEKTEIYEGDLLSEAEHYEADGWVNKRILQVVFECGSFMGTDGKEWTELDSNGFKVIGNIHENPELLK